MTEKLILPSIKAENMPVGKLRKAVKRLAAFYHEADFCPASYNPTHCGLSAGHCTAKQAKACILEWMSR